MPTDRLRHERSRDLHAASDVHTVLDRSRRCSRHWSSSDSVQTMSTEADGVTSGHAGRCGYGCPDRCRKALSPALILVGHVTKDRAIAGLRSLEHLVDVVLHFEGDLAVRCGVVRGVRTGRRRR